MQHVQLFLISLPVFILGDLLWLGFFARNFYQEQLGYLLGPVEWLAAICFYIIFLSGLVLFAINPAVISRYLPKALFLGAFFGFVTYATYDLTNQATIKDWPLVISLVDMAWGTFLGAFVSGVTFLLFVGFVDQSHSHK